ncbi:hypothetical protein [Luteolibacter sp. LG18]|uniref:hypothetical protein n=1 Tax=Luteolibacter sp. LG18 TaxID=2819286 RepID=UPI002B28932B|nr:hypothetical protein llg_15700 [Luteolibacter sp. LG18]
MAIKIIANYSKRLGLPGFSSHQFSVSVETELVTTDDLEGESQRLYQRLQAAVDEQIQTTGFVPPPDYGMADAPAASSSDRRSPPRNGSPRRASPAWRCSDKQRELITSFVDEHQLDRNEVERLATERFGKGVRQLTKLEASGLIDELLETYGGRQGGLPPNSGRSAYTGRGGRR